MQVRFKIWILSLALSSCVYGQEGEQSVDAWSFNASTLFYLIPDDFFVMPIMKAEKGRLHLEARYNYEDRRTGSVFCGYHFSGGKKLQYRLTPMVGAVVGQVDGIAPGLEAELTLGRFGFYSEMEYLFEFNTKSNSYYYNWSELTFAVTDWGWIGISGQRLRNYASDLSVERGLTAGGAWKSLELSGYFFNPFTDNQFGIISLSINF